MSSVLTEKLRNLLSQYNFVSDSGMLKESLVCLLCKELIIDAYQTYCGCPFCRVCIVDYLSKGDKYCPGNGTECKVEYLKLNSNVNPSSMLNRKVMKAMVVCSNELCRCHVELSQLEDHLQICSQPLIDCPYQSLGCDSSSNTKDSILSHLHNDTMSHTQLLIDLIHNLKNEVDVLKGNLKESKSEILTLTENTMMSKRENEELVKEIVLIKEISAQKEDKIAMLQEDADDKDIRINILEQKCKQLEINEWETAERMNKLDAKVAKPSTIDIGSKVFIVDRFKERAKAREIVFSSCFYSHINGYKVKLQVHPAGFKDGADTHLSVYIMICNGHYDGILSWPCKYCFDMAIINQWNGEIHAKQTLSYTTAENYCKDLLNKPISKRNDGYGFHRFMTYETLFSTDGLIVNDCVHIMCSATPPK